MMRIINYQGVEQLAVFVTEQSEVEMHLSQNKNVIFLKGTTLYLNHGSLNKNDYIPKEFLEIIKGHDVEVELSINTDAISSEILENSINIRFNGKDIKNPQDIYPGSKLTKAINFDDAKEKVEETLKTIVTKDNALDYALLLSAIKPSKLMYFSINNTTDFDFPIEYQLRYFYQDTDK